MSALAEPPLADPERLDSMLQKIAVISESGPGVTRLAFTELERRAHALVRSWYEALGLKTWVDPMGNSIAELPGAGPNSLPAIGTGSHLDSVPYGGRFDGISGVVGAVEVARIVTDSGLRPRHPLRFVAFAGEEGARFGQSCLGSKACAGHVTEQDLWTFKDRNGISVAEAMTKLGLNPSAVAEAAWSRQEWAGFIELHIEQWGTLEAELLQVGVVDVVSGSARFAIHLRGLATHSGTTPMHMRTDALAAAAEIVLLVEAIAKDARHDGTRGTVGVLTVAPGSITTIPGEVYLTVDIRDFEQDSQDEAAAEVVRRAQALCDRRGVHMTVTKLGEASPVVLPVWIQQVIAEVCSEMELTYRVMGSGASHDCQMINRVVPSGLLFVPSRAGLSHVPEEWTGTNDLVTGVDVLHGAIRLLDSTLDTPDSVKTPGVAVVDPPDERGGMMPRSCVRRPRLEGPH
jgi:allantoate deiminase